MENVMGSIFYRKIGIKLVKITVGLMNLIYTMFRMIQRSVSSLGEYA